MKPLNWRCPVCDYFIDCVPNQQNMDKHINDHPIIPINNVMAYECPSCALKGIRGNQMKEVK